MGLTTAGVSGWTLALAGVLVAGGGTGAMLGSGAATGVGSIALGCDRGVRRIVAAGSTDLLAAGGFVGLRLPEKSGRD